MTQPTPPEPLTEEPPMPERPLIVGKYPKTPGEANRALDADTPEPRPLTAEELAAVTGDFYGDAQPWSHFEYRLVSTLISLRSAQVAAEQDAAKWKKYGEECARALGMSPAMRDRDAALARAVAAEETVHELVEDATRVNDQWHQKLAAAEERTEFWKQRAERTLVELKRVNDAAEEKVAALEAANKSYNGREQVIIATESKLSIAVTALERISYLTFADTLPEENGIAADSMERIAREAIRRIKEGE